MTVQPLPPDYAARRMAVMVFACVTLALLAVGYWHYRVSTAESRQKIHQELAAIAALKASQVEQWMEERQDDADRLALNAFFQSTLANYLKHPENPRFKDYVLEPLVVEKKLGLNEDVLLLAPDGRLLLAVNGETVTVDPVLQRAIKAALAASKPVFSDFYLLGGRKDKVVIDVVAAVRDDGGQPLALLVFRRDPQVYLFPQLKSWPTPSRSAETVFSQREGDEVVFVNTLRNITNAPMQLRFPMTRTTLPAVQAALGREGIIEGIDYRGVPVLDDLHHIPGRPWVMITKIDQAEVFAEARHQTLLDGIIVGTLILLAAAGLAYFYRRRQFQFLLEVEQAKVAAQKVFRTTLYSIGDGVITTDAAGRVTGVNSMAEKLIGWCEVEALGRPLEEVFRVIHETTREALINPVQAVLREGRMVALANHALLIARDGTERPVADSAAPIHGEQEGIIGVVLVFSDQTRERAAQRTLQESEHALREAQAIARLGSYVLDVPAERWTSSDILGQIFGMEKAADHSLAEWLELVHPDDRAMMADYLKSEVIGRKQQFNREYRIRRRSDQAERWVHGLGRMEFDAEGRPFRMRGTIQDITDRKQSEAALRESEERYRRLFDRANDGIFLLSETGQLVFVNESFARMHGYSVDELQRMSLKDLDTPETMRGVPERMRRLLAGETLVFEVEHWHRDGRILPLEVSAGLVTYGGKTLIQAFHRDITERKQAEAAVRQSEEKFRTLTTLLPAGVYLADAAGRCVYVNPGWCEMTGLREEEALDDGWERVLHPEDRGAIMSAWNKMVASEGHWGQEYRFQTPAGKVTWVYGLVTPQRDVAGKLLGYVGVNMDITARKLAEDALQKSQTMLQNITNGTSDSIFVKDIDGLYLMINSAAAAFVGKSVEQVLGKDDRHLFPPEEARLVMEGDRRVMESGVTQTYEDIVTGGDGVTRTFLSTKGPLRDKQGKVVGLFGISRDITERKRAQEALRLSEQKVKSYIEYAGDAIYVLDQRSGRLLSCNQKACQQLGYRQEELLQMSAHDIEAEHQPEAIDKIHQLLAEKGMMMIEGVHRKKDGTTFPVEVTLSSLTFSDPPCLLSIVRDISERKLAEEAVRQSEQSYREIFNSVTDAIFLHDAKTGIIVDVNSAMLKLYGYSDKSEVVGRHPDDIGYGESPYGHAEATEWMRKALTEGSQVFEWCVPHNKKGDQLWVEVALHSATINGQPRVLAAVRDITERKLAEAEILRRAQELQAANEDLARFNRAAVDRELRMIQLKKEINHLCRQTGQPPPYQLDFSEPPNPAHPPDA